MYLIENYLNNIVFDVILTEKNFINLLKLLSKNKMNVNISFH